MKNIQREVDPTKIKLNDDKLENSIFRNVRSTLNREEMATNRESIRKLGLLKPIIVRPIKNDVDGYLYQLVCGSRRLRNILWLRQQSLDILKEKRPFKPEELCYCPETGEWHPATTVYGTVKSFIRECDDETAIRINVAENLEHSKVPEIDLMEFCQELVNIKNKDNTPRYTRTEVAELCNRCESWVSLTLDLNSLPEKIKVMMQNDQVTRTAALAFLQTERDKLEEVIKVSEKLVRDDKIVEATIIQEEIDLAEIDLSDAQNDISLHQMMQNEDLLKIAQKREGSSRKRVSAASEKRNKILEEIENPNLTADIINKAVLLVPGAKKKGTKPKAMATSDIRILYKNFLDVRDNLDCDEIALSIVNSLFEVILGHKACTNIENLLVSYEVEKAMI